MKLVRSKIPEIIAREGRKVRVHMADEHETWGLLCDKLIEEAQELKGAKSRDEIFEEVADLLEVLEAIQRALSACEEIDRIRALKLATRGAFENVVLHPPYRGVPEESCANCGCLVPTRCLLCPDCESRTDPT